PRDEQELVDRRQAPQLPVRHPGRVGDRRRQARADAPRRDLHRHHAAVLGLDGRRRQPRHVAPARADALRQGTAGADGARVARHAAGAAPPRSERSSRVSSALEIAGAALAHAAAAADQAEVSAHSERSGLARFAGSTQPQPTLVDDTVVTVRAVRDGRVGVAVTNRTGDDGLREVAARAADAAERVRADPDFPGLADPAEPARVDGYDDETAALGPDEQARLAAAAIAATGETPA